MKLLLRVLRSLSIFAVVVLPPTMLCAEEAIGAEAALLHDLEKMVEGQEAMDWKIDRYEIESIMPDALESVCATPSATRVALLARLGRRIDALGGPVDAAFRRRGKKLGEVSELLFVTRVRAV